MQEDALLPQGHFEPVSSRIITPCEFIRLLLTFLGVCDSVIILLSEGRSRQLGCSVLSSNSCLFNMILFSPIHSNHHLKNHLHYIHSVPHCWTNQCTSDSQRLCECAGILRNQSHPGASERIRGFPQGETAGNRGPLFSWLSSSTPISHFKYRTASSKSSMPECGVESQYEVTFQFALTDGKP